jgi:hypothetical protein
MPAHKSDSSRLHPPSIKPFKESDCGLLRFSMSFKSGVLDAFGHYWADVSA